MNLGRQLGRVHLHRRECMLLATPASCGLSALRSGLAGRSCHKR